MPRKRAIPTGATRRTCPDCLQHFGFMTETQFSLAWPAHLRSIRHTRWINAKNSAAERAAREQARAAGKQAPTTTEAWFGRVRASLPGKLPPPTA
jgi:hypothetical protein